MAKTACAICGKGLGILSLKTKISDGAVCTKCLVRAGMSKLSNPSVYDCQSIKELVATHQAMLNEFTPTKKAGSLSQHIELDEVHKTFKIGLDIFEYSNLLSYELLEDGETTIKGGLGSAVAGGLLFGNTGAVVGGVTGAKRATKVCTTMKLRISLKNAHVDMVYIDLISPTATIGGATEAGIRTATYNSARDKAQHCITLLDTINNVNQGNNVESIAPSQQFSSADEILKYKSLLDQGIITQAEFDLKKKELLNL